MLDEDRNDGGEEAGERGWSSEWSNQMARLGGSTPVAVLFLRVRYLNHAMASMDEVVAGLRRVNAALSVAGPTILTELLLSWGIRLLTLSCKSMTRERNAIRREIQDRLGWRGEK